MDFCLPWQPGGRSTSAWRPACIAEPPFQQVDPALGGTCRAGRHLSTLLAMLMPAQEGGTMRGTGWESEVPFSMQKNGRESSFQNHPASFSADSGNSRLLNLQLTVPDMYPVCTIPVWFAAP